MARTVEQLRIAAQEALEKARKLEQQAVEAETKAAQETAIADANRAIGDSVKNAIAAILEANPLPAGTWTLKTVVNDNTIGDFSLAIGNGNGHQSTNGNGKGSADNAFARPAYTIPEGHGLYVVDGEGNIGEAATLDEACDKLDLAHWCKSGNMTQKGDAPGRVLLKYASEHTDRVFTKAKS